MKVCAEYVAELEHWAKETVGQPISPCGICRPASGGARPTSINQIERTADGRTDVSGDGEHADGGLPGEPCVWAPTSTEPTARGVAASKSERPFNIRGPAAASPVVEAWADDYIRFERRPVWQEELRNEIRSRCSRLAPSAGQVLHATLRRPLPPTAPAHLLHGRPKRRPHHPAITRLLRPQTR